MLNKVLKAPFISRELKEMLSLSHLQRSLRPSDWRLRSALCQLRNSSSWSQQLDEPESMGQSPKGVTKKRKKRKQEKEEIAAPSTSQYDMRAPLHHSREAQLAHLTLEVKQLEETLRPPEEQYERKTALVKRITSLLERKMHGSFQTFGSCENGFWMRGSDVDSCLVMPHCAHRATQISKLRLAAALLQRAGFGSVEVVPARVPVAKLTCTRQEGENGEPVAQEEGDVSVNNTEAVENTKFVATMSGLDERVRPLGRVIKHWASKRQINSRSQGTLSTYTIILQLFYLMQFKKILPKFTDIAIPERFARPLLDNETGQMRPLPFHEDAQPLAERGQESLGHLFYDFFQIFGSDALRGGCSGTTFDDTLVETNDLGVLVMKCPLSGKNVNPMKIEVWQAIHSEFARAKNLLEQGASLSVICEPAESSPIQKRFKGDGEHNV